MARIRTAKVTKDSKYLTSSSQKNVKPNQKSQDSVPVSAVSKVPKYKEKGNAVVEGPVSTLSKEDVLALGGDDKDYEDLKDFDSDVELQSTDRPVDAKLTKEIARFVKSLKLYTLYKDAEEPSDAASAEEQKPSAPEASKETSKKKKVFETILPAAGPSKEISKSKTRLTITPDPHWYTVGPTLSAGALSTGLTNDEISKLDSRGEALFKKEQDAYASSDYTNALTASSSDKVFLQQILTSGTLSDRLSALTLMAQSSPLHNTKALESLKSMSQKKSRDESLKALRAIVDWWIGGGAPDRKLKYFREQPLNHPSVSDSTLLLWYFEDWLKKYFFGVIQTLEALSLDPLPYVRMQSITLIFTLLRDKPEQEQNLLRLLVNKLGDSEKQVASRASYHLLLLLQTHPQMKSIIIKEIANLILRPLTQKATSHPSGKAAQKMPSAVDTHDLQRSHSQYYGIITVNQMVFTPNDRDVAMQLLNLYFDLFKEILGEPDLDDSGEAGKSVEPKEDDENDERRKKGRGRGSKFSKKGAKTQRGDAGFAEVEDSRSKLLSAILTGVNRAFPFAKDAVATDDLLKRLDIIFRITHTSTFNISIQALRFLLNLSTTIVSTPLQSSSADKLASIPDRYYRTLYSSLEDPRLATSSKQSMYLNLLFKSITMDKDKARVGAFVRRFVQVLVCGANGGAEFAAGGLYLLAELFKYEPGLRAMFDAPSKDEQETYDPRKRDPKYANASTSPLWEFTPLLYHYHPTVRLYASQLLTGASLSGSADLSLNTLAHFLDRFVYKNPKTKGAKNVMGAETPGARGMSAMQPAAMAFDKSAVRIVKGAGASADGGREQAPVNEEWFVKMDVRDVPADELFFHQYFTKKRKGMKGKKDEEEDGDEEGEGGIDKEEDHDSDSDESEIWQAIKNSIPKGDDVGVDDDEDDDDEDDDLLFADDEEDDDDDDDDESGDEDGEESDEADDDDEDGDSDGELFKGFAGLDDEDEEDQDIPTRTSSKRTLDPESPDKGDEESGKKRKGKKAKKALPMFASYDEYETMVEDERGLQ